MTEVFGLHDRRAVEVFAYYCGPDAKDPLHAHFKATADHWIPISALDDDAAARASPRTGSRFWWISTATPARRGWGWWRAGRRR